METILKIKYILLNSTDVNHLKTCLTKLKSLSYIDFDIIHSTGIGKTVNLLRNHPGSVGLMSRSLIRTWKTIILANDPSIVVVNKRDGVKVDHHKAKFIDKSLFEAARTDRNNKIKQARDFIDKKESLSKSEGQEHNLAPKSRKRDNSEKLQVQKGDKRRRLTQTGITSAGSLSFEDALNTCNVSGGGHSGGKVSSIVDSIMSRKDTDKKEEFVNKRNTRTCVFSGTIKTGGGKCGDIAEIQSLKTYCLNYLISHIDKIEHVGLVPLEVFWPVLVRCSPRQLAQIEYYNPIFMKNTCELWRRHCERIITKSTPQKLDEDDWRSYYMKCSRESDRMLAEFSMSNHVGAKIAVLSRDCCVRRRGSAVGLGGTARKSTRLENIIKRM